MNIEGLDALMAEVDRKFNELKAEEGQLQSRLSQVDTELKRLQGEYAAYSKLKSPLADRTVPEDPAALTPDPFKKKSKGEGVDDASH